MISNENPEPLVSVYIPTKNRPALLKRAVDSVLAQTYPNVEIIVSDDGSTDDTPAVVGSWQQTHKNITYLRSEVSQGACAARNKAIRAARGKFITGLDDDDRFTPERIAEFVHAWRDGDSLLCAQSVNYTGTKEILSRYYQRVIRIEDLVRRNIIGNQIFAHRETLLANNLLFDENFPAWQDYELFTRIIATLGVGRRVFSHSYIQHTDHEQDRITNPKSILRGYRLYRKKHRNLLSRSQRVSLLVNVTVLMGRQPLSRLISLCWKYGNFYDLFKIYKAKF